MDVCAALVQFFDFGRKKTVGSFLCAGYPLTRFGAGKERENLFHSRGQAPVSLVGAK